VGKAFRLAALLALVNFSGLMSENPSIFVSAQLKLEGIGYRE
jgi:hypothetical protein